MPKRNLFNKKKEFNSKKMKPVDSFFLNTGPNRMRFSVFNLRTIRRIWVAISIH